MTPNGQAGRMLSRDEFAIAAMVEFMRFDLNNDGQLGKGKIDEFALADAAYEMADAMINAREPESPEPVEDLFDV